MKKIIILLVILLCIFPLTAQERELTIMTEDWPPFNYEEDGVIKGISVDIVREMMDRLGLSYDIWIFPWARAYDYIQNEDNHVLFSMAYSEEREALFKWVGPLAEFQISLYARKDLGIPINSLEDARKVGFIGVPRESLAHTILKNQEFENLLPLNNALTMIKMLYNRRIDLMCGANLAFQKLPEGMEYVFDDFHEVFLIKKTELNIVFSLNVPDSIVEEWQQTLDEMIEDGTVAAIKAEY